MISEHIINTCNKGLKNNTVFLTKSSQVMEVMKGLSLFEISCCTGSFLTVNGKVVFVKTFSQAPELKDYHLEVSFEGELSSEEKSNLKKWLKGCLD